jgi:hypothetical protein
MVFYAHYEIRSSAPPKKGRTMNYPHAWDDAQQQAAYASQHRYENFPDGLVDGVDPSRYLTQDAYYAAQYDAYTAQRQIQQTAGVYYTRIPRGRVVINDDHFWSLHSKAHKQASDVIYGLEITVKYSRKHREEISELQGLLASFIQEVDGIESSDDNDYGKALQLEFATQKLERKKLGVHLRYKEEEEIGDPPEDVESTLWKRFMNWLYS